MSPFGRNLILTVVLALLAGAAGAWGGVTLLGRSEHAPASMHALLHEELDLSPEQEQRLEVLEARFAPRRAGLEGELRTANAELARAMRSSGRYGLDVQTAIDHFHATMGQLQKETVLHVFEMRALLTPEQAAVFDRRVGEALSDEAT